MYLAAPLATTSPPTWDWALTLAVLSLAISLTLAIRELSSRPIPIAHLEKAHQKADGEWGYIGFQMTLANAGRASMIVHGIGIAVADKTGYSGFTGQFEWAGTTTENPALPIVLEPGEALVYLFPAERYPEKSGPFRITMLKRNLLRRARAKVTAIDVPVREQKENG